MTTTPTEPVPPPAPSTISAGALIGGLLLALFLGAAGNILAGLIATSVHEKGYGFLIGLVPGVVFVLLGLIARRSGFCKGMLIGGCIVALVGGACGASMVNMSFH
jgi:hypothetical protein